MSSEAILFTDPEDIRIMRAALRAAVEGEHWEMALLTQEQWDRARELFAEFNASVEFTEQEAKEKQG